MPDMVKPAKRAHGDDRLEQVRLEAVGIARQLS
jgi:hypothetical protein